MYCRGWEMFCVMVWVLFRIGSRGMVSSFVWRVLVLRW